MSEPVPYRDYVRIEVHTAGVAEIIEFRPDELSKVKAELRREYPSLRDVEWGGLVRERPAGQMAWTLAVSADSATRTTKSLDETQGDAP